MKRTKVYHQENRGDHDEQIFIRGYSYPELTSKISDDLLLDGFLVKKIIKLYGEKIEQIQEILQHNQTALERFNVFTAYYIKMCLNYPHILKLTYYIQQNGLPLQKMRFWFLDEFVEVIKKNNVILSEVLLQGQIEGCFDPHIEISLLVNSFFFTLNLLISQHNCGQIEPKGKDNFLYLLQDYVNSVKSIISIEGYQRTANA